MNKFEIKKCKTDYGYSYMGILIDDIPLDKYLSKLTCDKSFEGLMPCFFESLESKAEQEYISRCLKVESTDGINIPILLCPDDMDFWCTVIVAKVIYMKDNVIWNKIGIVQKSNWSNKEWDRSGIKNFEMWNDEEWSSYGSYFDLFDLEDSLWKIWIRENWKEEELRRINNYTHKYLNNDDNIQWLINLEEMRFDKCTYRNMVNLGLSTT